MEHAIGKEIILSNGKKVKVVEVSIDNGCRGCYNCRYMLQDKRGACTAMIRTDNKDIIYKEIKED